MAKEITIYDIADKVGLSPTTVSRALSDSPSVRPKTKEKVNQAAKSLGYRSNIFAASLRKKSTHNIGVIVPRLNSSFQSSVLAGMENIASQAQYNLIISQSLESSKKEQTNALTMYNSHVDGLLVSMAGNTGNTDHFKPFTEKGIPLIFFDRTPDEPSSPSIIIDNTQAAYAATSHLLDQGCRNIHHIVGNSGISTYKNRIKGFKYALMDRQLPYTEEQNIFSVLNEESGEEIANIILQIDPLPDGLVISNDACAASCIQYLKKKGIRIPQDIAIVGFNNDAISRLIEPNLSTINYPGYEMGEIAMRNLLLRLSENDDSPGTTETITLKSELIVRESSLKK